jgi:adenylosuccinate synthase
MHSSADTDAARPAAVDGEQPQGEAAMLDKLNLAAGHCAIVGLQWGDEGKGKVVDLLSRHFDLVVRYNGGANAGHSVQVGDERYALHLIPSGILYPEKLNILANGVVIAPAQLVSEIQSLRERGLQVDANLKISDRAHLVLPYHKAEDGLFDEAVAQAWDTAKPIGTTGRGIGPAYADKALRSTAIRVGELRHLDRVADKLERTVAVKNVLLQALAERCGRAFEPFDPKQIYNELKQQAEILHPHICDTTALLHQAMDEDKRLLFEGANATLLDIDHGTYPYVTSSNCSSLGVHTGAAMPGHQVPNVVGIAKAYQTRVGGGPMPTELHDETGQRIRDNGNEYGTTTGRPRRCGWLDLVALRYTTRLTGATGLALMLVDVLAGLPELKVCTAYRYQGRTLTEFPADAEVLASVEPVYETLPGFDASIEDCRQFDELPEPCRQYVQRIEQFVGAPIVMLSVGPRRDQTVLRS